MREEEGYSKLQLYYIKFRPPKCRRLRYIAIKFELITYPTKLFSSIEYEKIL